MFIVSLAVSDLTVGLVVMPISTVYVLAARWPFGLAVCQLWLVADYTASTASILNLLVLSADRYWSVVDPLRYGLRRRTVSRAAALIVGVWSASALWVVPIVGWHQVFGNGSRTVPDDECDTEYAENSTLKVGTALVNYFVPLGVMVVLYSRIFVVVRRRRSDIAAWRQMCSERTPIAMTVVGDRRSDATAAGTTEDEDACVVLDDDALSLSTASGAGFSPLRRPASSTASEYVDNTDDVGSDHGSASPSSPVATFESVDDGNLHASPPRLEPSTPSTMSRIVGIARLQLTMGALMKQRRRIRLLRRTETIDGTQVANSDVERDATEARNNVRQPAAADPSHCSSTSVNLTARNELEVDSTIGRDRKSSLVNRDKDGSSVAGDAARTDSLPVRVRFSSASTITLSTADLPQRQSRAPLLSDDNSVFDDPLQDLQDKAATEVHPMAVDNRPTSDLRSPETVSESTLAAAGNDVKLPTNGVSGDSGAGGQIAQIMQRPIDIAVNGDAGYLQTEADQTSWLQQQPTTIMAKLRRRAALNGKPTDRSSVSSKQSDFGTGAYCRATRRKCAPLASPSSPAPPPIDESNLNAFHRRRIPLLQKRRHRCHRHRNHHHQHRQRRPAPLVGYVNGSATSSSSSSSAMNGDVKAARQLGVIVAAFCACFLPYFVCFVVVAFCRQCVSARLMTAVTWIGYVNSTLNPFLYPLCNRQFRDCFRRMFARLAAAIFGRTYRSSVAVTTTMLQPQRRLRTVVNISSERC
jgi:hypothetical protein